MEGLLLKYFVLRPKGIDAHADASRDGMRGYSNRIRLSNPLLADEIDRWIRIEQKEANRMVESHYSGD